jgi:hypothetical protein
VASFKAQHLQHRGVAGLQQVVHKPEAKGLKRKSAPGMASFWALNFFEIAVLAARDS